MSTDPNEPGLGEQTLELGKTLRALMEQDAAGTPSDTAAAVFAEWLAAVGPVSREPLRFADVAENYPVRENTNKDLFDLFVFLESNLVFDEPEPESEPGPPATFIGLPMAN